MSTKLAVIGGAGTGSRFSHALVESLLERDFHVAGITRSAKNKAVLEARFEDPRIRFHVCDLNDGVVLKTWLEAQINEGFTVEVYIHQAAKLILKPFLETGAGGFEESWRASVRSAVIAMHTLLPHMLEHGRGTVIFSGATASIRGGPKSAAFSAAKAGLRAFAQSLAREFGPRGIHIAHVIVDGVITGDRAQGVFDLPPDQCIRAESLAKTYLDIIGQDPSCWTHELDVRPAGERF